MKKPMFGHKLTAHLCKSFGIPLSPEHKRKRRALSLYLYTIFPTLCWVSIAISLIFKSRYPLYKTTPLSITHLIELLTQATLIIIFATAIIYTAVTLTRSIKQAMHETT